VSTYTSAPPVDVRDVTAQNLGLAYKIASTFARRAQAVGLDIDDLRQEAVVAMMKAAAAFDPARGFAFSTLAGRSIQYHLIRVLDTRRFRRLLGLPTDGERQMVDFADPNELTPEATAEATDDQRMMQQLLGVLRLRHRQVIEMYYFMDYTLAEVGQQIGVSKERARQLLAGALKRMRKYARQDVATSGAGSSCAFSSASRRRPAS
jgi:RNA polymerase sigma factor (sigma-70 family)